MSFAFTLFYKINEIYFSIFILEVTFITVTL